MADNEIDTNQFDVVYSVTVNTVTSDKNEAPIYPLVQGTLPTMEISVMENDSVIPITTNDVYNFNAVVVNYCKLDNAPVIHKITNSRFQINGDIYTIVKTTSGYSVKNNGINVIITDDNKFEVYDTIYTITEVNGNIKVIYGDNLVVDTVDMYISNGKLTIKSDIITSNYGKCALILKYTNGYTTYSTPLYYYVNANPMAGIEFATE